MEYSKYWNRSLLGAGLLLVLSFLAPLAKAREAWHDWCSVGAKKVVTSGLQSTTLVQASQGSCVVTVYIHGAGLATIYADNNGTPLANPFTAQTNGEIIWYADDGKYDEQYTMTINGVQISTTISDILLCDPFVAGAVCSGGGGGGSPHNLLSTTHLDTIPASPPTRGDVITAQAQISPAGTNPSWARLALGTNGQVLTSNGTDAIWATPAGGSGCTLPGINIAVLSEHPAGTCYDSLHWTWDDGTNKQVMLLGDGTNSATTARMVFLTGVANSHTGSGLCCGDEVFLTGDNNISTNSSSLVWTLGSSNTINNVVDQYIIGEGTTTRNHGGPDFIIGRNNTLGGATTNQNIFDMHVFGKQNTISTSSGKTVSLGVVAGSLNSITSTTNSISGFHILGGSNTLADTLGLTQEVEVVGEQNQVDGAASTLQIVGFLNIAHNVSQQGISTTNQVIVGSANTATNTGASGTPAYMDIFGHSNSQTTCSNCIILGANITQSTNNQLAIGMAASATPAFLIAPNGSGDNVLRTPHAFSYYPACAAGTEGSIAAITDSSTAVWGATITGSSTNHVLGYCDGTNWTVAGK